MDDVEEWRQVPGCPDYEVSDWGRVRSWRNGRWPGKPDSPRLLRPNKNRGGYLGVTIGGVQHRIHYLVLITFVGPRPQGFDSCHNNDKRDDNRASNLRWDTRSNNIKQAVRDGNWKSPWERIGYVKQ